MASIRGMARTDGPWHGWLAAFLATLLAFALPAPAGAAADASPIELGDAGRQELAGHYSLFCDATGAMDIAAIRRADGEGLFLAQRSRSANLGYVRGACWIRMLLSNPGRAERMRWLRLEFTMQHAATLFIAHGDSRVERMDNGVRVATAERDLPTRQILFPLRLAAGENARLYLRLSGNSLTKAHLTLWQPAAYIDAELRATALKYLALGASLIVTVFAVLAWETRRRPGLLLGAVANVLAIAILFIVDGMALDWLPASPELWPYRLRDLLIYLMLACDVVFTSAFLDLPRHAPRLARAMRWLALGALLLAARYPFSLGDQEPQHYTLLAYIAALVGVAVFSTWRGIPFARLYLLAWGLLWLGILLRSLVDFGALPQPPMDLDLILLGYIACALTLSLALYLDIHKLRADAEAAHYRLLRHQLDEKQRLAEAVEAQTRDLREAKQLAEEASRAKTTFLSEVSHELRAPLHTILGYAHLLERQAVGDMAAKLAIISNSGAQLVRLIDDVLAYSRGEVKSVELDIEPMSLPALVGQLEQSASLQAEQRGNRFQVGLAPGLPTTVRADQQRLAQVLQNLINNACKFTQNGDIRLSIAPEPGRAGARVGAATLRFMVEDNGIGIADEDQERVFTPFYRIRNTRRQPGIGLGLAISRHLLRAMGGDIHLESAPGRGSRFSFSLTFDTTQLDPPATPDPAARRIRGHKGRRRTLLVVDDNADNQGFLRQLCGNWGFAAVTAGDGDEAFAACVAADPAFDAALVDQYMPGADGWDFLRAIRESPTLARLPVILVSAAPAARPVDFPSGLAFDGILMKPLQAATLAQFLAQCLSLEWIWEEAAPESGFTTTSVRLAPDEAERLREALALGQILDLQRHAGALAERAPECAAFAEEIIRLCGLVDLPGLRRLFERALPAADTGATREATG